MSEARTFTNDEVQEIVRKRLSKVKSSGLNDVVIVEMLRNVLARLDAIEEEMKR